MINNRCSVALGVIIALISGCRALSIDVGNHDDVSDVTGYRVGNKYVLKRDVYVFKAGWNSGHELRDVESLSNELPRTLDLYKHTPQNWPTIKGVLSKGDIVEVTSYRLTENPVAGMLVDVSAVVQNGPHRGLKISLRRLSKKSNQSVRRKEFDSPFNWLLIDSSFLQIQN